MSILFPWFRDRHVETGHEVTPCDAAVASQDESLHLDRAVNRRRFLLGAMAAGCGLATGSFILPTPAVARLVWPDDRWLNLVNANTGEVFGEWYVVGGKYRKDAYHRFCWFARDWRENKAIQMHPSLMDLLYALHQEFRQDTIRVNSGYRTPKTNAKLEGAALRSQHLRGTALDVVVPQRSSRDVADLVRDLIPGGVGWYPKSGFVHADLGPYRSWRG